MAFSDLLGNPMIQRYLLSMGAGMMGQQGGFGNSLANGVKAGNLSMIDSLDEAEKQKQAEKQRIQNLTDQRGWYDYQVNDKSKREDADLASQAAGIRELASQAGLDFSKLDDKSTVMFGKEYAQEAYKAKKGVGGGGEWQSPSIDPSTGNITRGSKSGGLQIYNPNGQLVFDNTQGSSIPAQVPQLAAQAAGLPSATVAPTAKQSAPAGWNSTSASNPVQEKEQFKSNLQKDENKQRMLDEAKIKQDTADKELLNTDPSKMNSIMGIAANSAETDKNIKAYEDQVAGNPLMDNKVVFQARNYLGSDPVVTNLDNDFGQTMVNQIKALKAAGIAPTQMMNTETEYQRQKDAITGGGNTTTFKQAKHAMDMAHKRDLMEYESLRKQAADRLNVEYKPLLDVNTLPGAKIYEIETGSKQIGSTGVVNGKKIRVIGKNQVEVIE